MKTFLKNLALFFAAGATMVAILWSSTALYFYFYNDDFYEQNFDLEFLVEEAGDDMRSIVIQLELYKQAFGFYPEDLDDALTGYQSDYDPSIPDCGCPHSYIYATDAIGSTFNLQSKGQDCEAFTPDDHFPLLSPRESSASGFTPIRIAESALPIAGCGG